MADIKDLILTVVSPLVSHPDELTIDVVETEEFLEYQYFVEQTLVCLELDFLAALSQKMLVPHIHTMPWKGTSQ